MEGLSIEKKMFSLLFARLLNQAESLALVGLGYVGMPIAVVFAKKGLQCSIAENKVYFYW